MKKLTYEYVKNFIESKRYKLLSKEYINNRQKLEYICPEGHEHSTTWTKWQQGVRCPYCANVGRPSIEFIKSDFAKENYQLLTNKYKNAHQKLEYVCPEGHKHNIRWNNWQQGQRCPYCANRQPIDINFIKHEFAKENYELLTTEYKNCKQKLNYICPRGHKHSITWNDWKTGCRCAYCATKAKKTIDFIKGEFKEEGYELLTKKYTNAQQKLDYICPKGHKHSISWGNWKTGYRCPYCIGIISKEETQVKDFVISLGVKISPNDRHQIFNPETNYGLELDIFMPDLNKAIEYNGEYWHQDKDRDSLKQQLCRNRNIDLLTIWDKEWINDYKGCQEKIKNFVKDKTLLLSSEIV